MNNILGIIGLAMAAIVGAGFSSGKEIAIFFNNTGNYGILNIILAILVFFFTFYYVFKLISKHDIDNFSDLVKIITNEKIAKFALKSTKSQRRNPMWVRRLRGQEGRALCAI